MQTFSKKKKKSQLIGIENQVPKMLLGLPIFVLCFFFSEYPFFIVNLSTFSNPILIFSNVQSVYMQTFFKKKKTSQFIGIENQVPKMFLN